MNKFILEVLAFILICLAVLGMIHQKITTWDPWFDLHDIFNYESPVVCLVMAAITLLAGKYLGKLGL